MELSPSIGEMTDARCLLHKRPPDLCDRLDALRLPCTQLAYAAGVPGEAPPPSHNDALLSQVRERALVEAQHFAQNCVAVLPQLRRGLLWHRIIAHEPRRPDELERP